MVFLHLVVILQTIQDHFDNHHVQLEPFLLYYVDHQIEVYHNVLLLWLVGHLELPLHANTMYGNFDQFHRKTNGLKSFEEYGISYYHIVSMDI